MPRWKHKAFWVRQGDEPPPPLAEQVGVISPSGNEVGPFMTVEQSVLSDLVDPESRTAVFAW